MALIKCPECKKKISDQCENCPQCGYPIKDNLQRVNTEDNTKETVVLEKKPFYKNHNNYKFYDKMEYEYTILFYSSSNSNTAKKAF